jgi:hypothetical protein
MNMAGGKQVLLETILEATNLRPECGLESFSMSIGHVVRVITAQIITELT